MVSADAAGGPDLPAHDRAVEEGELAVDRRRNRSSARRRRGTGSASGRGCTRCRAALPGGELVDEVLPLQADPEDVGQEVVEVGAEDEVTDEVVVDRDAGERLQLEAPPLEERLARNDDDVGPASGRGRARRLGPAADLFLDLGRLSFVRLQALAGGGGLLAAGRVSALPGVAGGLVVAAPPVSWSPSRCHRRPLVARRRCRRLPAALFRVAGRRPSNEGNPYEKADGRSLHDPSLSLGGWKELKG